MKEITLTRGKVALVDDEDYEQLSSHKWTAHKAFNTWYAKRHDRSLGHVTMHREILGLKFGDGIIGDHKDFNGLNNQRYNLRACSKLQNNLHTEGRTRRKRGKYRGVWSFQNSKRKKPWVAKISVHGIAYTLGVFYTEEAAALAYNLAAQRHFGEFARLNVL